MLSTYDDWFHHGENPGIDMIEDPKHQFVEDQIHDEFLEEDIGDNGGALRNLVDDAYGT